MDLHCANKCKPKSSLERCLNVTSCTSNLHYPYTECNHFYQCQSQPYSHLQNLSYPIDLVRSISVFLNTMAFTSICLLFSHYDFLWNVSAVSVCKWCWIVLTYAGVFLFLLNCALMSHKQTLLFELTCLLSSQILVFNFSVYFTPTHASYNY